MFNKNPDKKITDSIIIFLRYPKRGKVKTRLAKTTSPEFALSFYKTCAESLVSNLKRVPSINRFVFYSDKGEEKEVINWLGNKIFFMPQDGEDIGIRMKKAFEKIFSLEYQKVIIVGTDIPDLSKKIIIKAFKALDNKDIVIGPSKDGGYYLLGMKEMHNKLFEGIKFSTSSVLSETLLRIKKLKLSYDLLQVLQDIDTEDDLNNWLNDKRELNKKTAVKFKAV